MNRVHKLAFTLFGKYTRKNKESYSAIQAAIRQAHIDLPWDMYVSTAYFYAIITGVSGAVFGLLLMPLWRIIYANIQKFMPGAGVTVMHGYGESIFLLIVELVLSVFLCLFTYYAILNYPVLSAKVRKGKIEITLPHAVAYMHALSKGGMSLISIFKSLSEHVNIYGEIAEEFAYIVMDTEMHGSDLVAALKNAAVRTQSEKFRDFLENLVNTAETGADMETFFSNMVSHYQSSAEADQRMYLEMLGMLAETYVTVFVAGPLFLITIFIVMGIMGSVSLFILQLLIYAVIPLSAIAFSILLSAMSLGNDNKLVKVYRISRKIRHYDEVRNMPFAENDARQIRKLMRSLRWTSVIEAKKNPVKPFFANPFRAFYVTIPVAIIYFILSTNHRKITVDLLDDVIIIGILILCVPFLFFYEMQSRRIRQIENSVPSFLRRLAAINDVGMPFAVAIKSLSQINLGVLSTEVKLMYRDVVWSNNILDALMKFERRIRTISISRIITLITKASESTGNIKETLRVAATDAALAEKLRREKFTVLFSYLLVVYMSFAVFLLVLYVFDVMFLPQIPETSGAVSGMFSISGHKEEYSRLFMHASVIQGFFSGAIAGQMMGESVYDGLKHSVIMMTVAYVFFVWFI